MQAIRKTLRFPIKPSSKPLIKPFSTTPSNGNGNGEDDAAHWGGSTSNVGWDVAPKAHHDGKSMGRPLGPVQPDKDYDAVKDMEGESKWASSFASTWDKRLKQTTLLLNQVREPGIRGSYLKDSEKAEMYKKHKENPDVYTVERLAKEYRIMRQRVHAILWLKKDEEEEGKLGKPLDDTVEILLDALPECFKSHDREFHVARLPHKPDFRVMPEGWDGITRDPDEVHYEISMREDKHLYEEFVQRFSFNIMRMNNQVKVHKYSRKRPSEGWNFMVEKLGPSGRCGNTGWKFISQADGSSRPVNDYEMMFVKKDTPSQRKKIVI